MTNMTPILIGVALGFVVTVLAICAWDMFRPMDEDEMDDFSDL